MTKALAGLVVLVAVFALPAAAQEDADRHQVFSDIEVRTGETAGDAICHYCSIRVHGAVAGDAVAIGGSIEITGRVTGDAVAVGGVVRLGPGAVVGCDAVSVGGPLERAPGATVGRDAASSPWYSMPGQRELFLRGVLLSVVLNFGFVVLAFLMARAPRVEATARALTQFPVWVGLTGLAVLALATGLYVLAARLRTAAVPAAVLASGLLLITGALGYAGLCRWLGGKLVRGDRPLKSVLVGTALLTLLQLVPILGLLIFLLLCLLTPGAGVFSGFGQAPDWLRVRLRRRRAAATGPATRT